MFMRKLFIGLLFLFFMLSDTSDAQINVVVSAPPFSEFVESVCDGEANVRVFAERDGQGSLHNIESSFAKADVFVSLGELQGYDSSFLSELLKINPELHFLDLSQGLDLIEYQYLESVTPFCEILGLPNLRNTGKIDPHVWLSLRNAVIMVRNVRDFFVVFDDKNAARFRRNAESYISQLNRVHANISQELYRLRHKHFISMHCSWAYFARDYSLVELVVPVNGTKKVDVLERLTETSEAFDVEVVLASSKGARFEAYKVAERIGAVVRNVDPYKKEYLENMAYVASILKFAGSDEKYR